MDRRVVAIDGFALTPGPNTSGGQTVIGTGTATIYVFPHAAPNAGGFGGAGETSPYGGGPPGMSGGPPGMSGGPGRGGA